MNHLHYNAQKGSITVESAIVLPVVIIAILFFVYIIKLYYTVEVMQHAISETSQSMGVYSLLYYKTNGEKLISGIEKFCSSEEVDKSLGSTGLSGYIQDIGSEVTDYARAQVVLVPITRLLVKNNLNINNFNNVDTRLKSLNVKNGFAGLDFSESRMLSDERSIDIIVKYEVNFPVLSRIIPAFKIRQNSSSCIWAGEDGISEEQENANPNSDCIWDKDNLERGKEIRKLEGANLPDKFPTIAKFNNGRAISIKSLNIDEAYYTKPGNIKRKIESYINKLDKFEGANSYGINIRNNDITSKELILVIPETDISISQKLALEQCISEARVKGIVLTIKKAYGKSGGQDESQNAKLD